MSAEEAALVRFAQAVGPHALAIYLGLLAGLMLAAWAGWWAMQRSMAPPRPDAVPAPWVLGVRLALGFGAIVGCGWVFAEIAEALHAQAALGAADQAITDAIRRSVPPLALQGFAAVTRLADTATLTLLCIAVGLLLVGVGRRWLAVGWVAAVSGNAVLNTTLKQVFERARPLHDDGLVAAQGFSFPSGHTSGAVVAYGMLAYVVMRFVPARWHGLLLLAAVALAFSIGASRVFLRVHFASDVVAGFASGTAWLAVCIGSIEMTRWYRGRTRLRADR